MGKHEVDRTVFFQTCMGVFQGGGCAAAALVGSYQAAVSHGAQFIEVAGTSAGSIVAALVGAGATPDQLVDFICNLNFKRFLIPPISSTRSFPLSWFQRRVAKSLGGQAGVDLLTEQGMYSSAEIENWISECLSKLLPGVKSPVTFGSLRIPTAVVATDLLRYEVKVWSTRFTPDEGVAHAVRASCSIPVYFQPVDGRYVDGGVLSNLPTFIFQQNRAESDRPMASRTLAFSLRAEEPDDPNAVGKPTAKTSLNPLMYLRALANTIVSGSVDLQQAIQPDVYTVSVCTGNVQATDFDRMDESLARELIKKGADAAHDFFRNERTIVRGQTNNVNVCFGLDETYTAVVERLDDPVEEVLISEQDSKWVYAVFPALLTWRLRGVRIRVALQKPISGDQKEAYRRRILRAIGAELTEHESVLLRAYLFDPSKLAGGAVAVVRLPETSGFRGFDAVRYDAPIDGGVIAALHGQLDALCPRITAAGQPRLIHGDDKDIVNRLKKVPQYSTPNVTLQVQTVKTEDLQALALFVREYKYRQISVLYDLFRNGNWSPFEPLLVEFADGRTSVVTPPVVEDIGGDRYAVIEGSTRSTFVRNEGIDKFRCVVATGVNKPLPAKPQYLGKVRIVGKTLEVHKRYENWNYNLFRPIEETVHDPSTLP